MLISGKRNDFVDLGIIEPDLSGPLGVHDGKPYPVTGLAAISFQNLLDASQDQLFGGTALAGRARLEAAVNRVRDIDRGSHIFIVPYLWSMREIFYR